MITDEQILNETINKIFEEGKNVVIDTKKNINAINFLLGKVMMATHGRADPKITMKLIRKKLEQI
jgi:aspartyl-tRNA(Asn)/glutamyl-tRNA(Gln) amidotransferase subunit B